MNAFFDLDGTLVDPALGFTRCVRHALERLGKDSPDDTALRRFIGPPLRSSFAKLLNTNENSCIERAVEFFRERYTTLGILENEVYPGVAEMLCFLNGQNIRIHVVTSKPKSFAEIVVRHFFDRQLFSDIFGTGLDGQFDNKADLVRLALGSLQLDPGQAVMIGDRKEDILAGKTNRTRTIGVIYGYGTCEEVSDSRPDYICSAPSEISRVMAAFSLPTIEN